jgi:hypothetical protein
VPCHLRPAACAYARTCATTLTRGDDTHFSSFPFRVSFIQTFEEYSWLDDDTIIAPVIPAGRPAAPARPATPRGPRIQSSTKGVAAQARTYTDLLKDSHDAALFAHFCTSALMRVPVAPGGGPATPLGAGAAPRLYTRVDASVDAAFLIVEFLEGPFSYLVPCGRFPKRVQLWRADGSFVRELAALPLAESIPIVNDSCRAGPRGISWRADAPATLYWAEAQDGGDPRIDAETRDIVFALDVSRADAATAAPRELLRTAWRYGGVSWGDGALALAYESRYKCRTARTWAFAPDAALAAAEASAPPPPMRLFQERNYEDAYTDPGAPVTRRLPNVRRGVCLRYCASLAACADAWYRCYRGRGRTCLPSLSRRAQPLPLPRRVSAPGAACCSRALAPARRGTAHSWTCSMWTPRCRCRASSSAPATSSSTRARSSPMRAANPSRWRASAFC